MQSIKKRNLFLTTALVSVMMVLSAHAGDNPFDGAGNGENSPGSQNEQQFSFPTPPPTPPKTEPNYEKCYGVSGKDENNCAFATFTGTPNDAAGTSEPCDPASWRWVPKGMCKTIVVGTRKDGTILNGTLHPSMERGFPVKCTPYRGGLSQSQSYGL